MTNNQSQSLEVGMSHVQKRNTASIESRLSSLRRLTYEVPILLDSGYELWLG